MVIWITAALAATAPMPTDAWRFEELALGDGFGCGRTSAGEVRCWGAGDRGQLGVGPAEPAAAPIAVPGVSGATALVVGDRHACVILRDRRLLCWGDNTAGQAGPPGVDTVATPTEVPGVGPVRAAAAGGGHTCAVTMDGAVVCFGDNLYGQLGVGGLGASSRPVPVPDVERAFAVSAGYGHSCAAVRGDPAVEGAADFVLCWGDHQRGQLGRADAGVTNPQPPGPVAAAWTALRGVASRGDQSCGVDSTGVTCWGGSVADATPRRRVQASDLVTVSVGQTHGCGLTGGGRVVCWGDGAGGLLGSRAPRPLVRGAFGLTDAVGVVAGVGETCAARDGDPAVCWGAWRPDEVSAAKVEMGDVSPAARRYRALPPGTELVVSADELLVPGGARPRVVIQTVDNQPCANSKLFATTSLKGKAWIVDLGDPFLPDGDCIAAPGPASAVVEMEAGEEGRRDLVVRYKKREDMYQLYVSSTKIEVIPLQSTFSAWRGETAMWRVREGSLAVSCREWLDAPICHRRSRLGMPGCEALFAERIVADAPRMEDRTWASAFFSTDPGALRISPDFDLDAYETLFRRTYEDGSGCTEITVRTWAGETWSNQP
jgi:alpha-tubulin suppressor-like RCC1 family protein